MRKIISMVLALALTLSLGTTALAAESNTGSLENFKPTNTYSNQFSDVKESDWFYSGVKLCYEMGLMNGTSATTFNPNGNVTKEQLTIIAARLYSIYHGEGGEIPAIENLPNIDMGNQSYYYLKDKLGKENVALLLYNEPAERWAVGIFGQVLPDEVFAPINNIEKVPDFSSFPQYRAEGMETQVLKMYNAGIITGSDEYGTFYNQEPITRAAVAAIVARIVAPSLRTKFTPKEGKPNITGVMCLDFNDCPNFMKFYEENKQYFTFFNNENLTISNVPAPQASFEMTVEKWDNGYRVSHLWVGENAKRQHELLIALFQDVCEDPDAIYAKILEQEEIMTKGWTPTTGFTQEAKDWQTSQAWKEYRIGNVLFKWGENCGTFTIKTAS